MIKADSVVRGRVSQQARKRPGRAHFHIRCIFDCKNHMIAPGDSLPYGVF